MGIKYEHSEIILTGSTGRTFNEKMHRPKIETFIKRDAYFKEIDNNLKTKIVSDKKIIIK
jgi:hypothetical protein